MKFRFRYTELIKQNSGLTMIELLIAFVIFGILVVAVTPVFKQGSDSWQDTKAEVELRQNLNSALQFMSREMRQAKEGNINTGAGNEIVRYKYDYDYDTSGHHNFIKRVKSGSSYYLEFNGDPITAPELINITHAEVEQDGSNPVYNITISGEYIGRNEANSGNRKLTVETTVVVRSTNNLEEWREDT